jgi:hypothetical protein
MKNMIILVLRAARLRRDAFQHVADDPNEILKSFGTVLMASMLFGLGLVGVVGEGAADLDTNTLLDRLISLWLVAITTLLGWVMWSASTHILGGKFLRGGGEFRELLRSQGIGYGPLALAVLLPLATVGPPLFFVGVFWVLVTGVVGAHEVQDNDWFSVVLSTLPGWALFVFGLLVITLSSVGVQGGG